MMVKPAAARLRYHTMLIVWGMWKPATQKTRPLPVKPRKKVTEQTTMGKMSRGDLTVSKESSSQSVIGVELSVVHSDIIDTFSMLLQRTKVQLDSNFHNYIHCLNSHHLPSYNNCRELSCPCFRVYLSLLLMFLLLFELFPSPPPAPVLSPSFPLYFPFLFTFFTTLRSLIVYHLLSI